MSASGVAEKDKAPAKPSAPMGSFLGKLQEKGKPAPKPEEKAHESGANPEPVVAAKPVAATPDKPEPVPAAPAKTEGQAQPAKTGEADKGSDAQAPDEAAKLEKRLKDTQASWHEEHKARLKAERDAKDFKDRLDRIEKKLDGTYEPAPIPTPEQQSADAQVRGRIEASHDAAVSKYGEEYVMKTVWAEDSPYQELQKNPLIRERVMTAKSPVLEAIKVVLEDADIKKYGRTSEEWKRSIEEELRPKITQEVLTSLKAKPGPATNTLGNVRGEADRTAQKGDVPSRLDFKSVFPWGASRT